MAAALVVVAPRVSHAQDADEGDVTKVAKEHFKLGKKFFDEGKYPEAVKELRKAYLVKHLPPILVNIARTYEKLNDPDNAIFYYKKYLAEAPPDAKDRGEVKQAIEDAVHRKEAATAALANPEKLERADVPGAKPTAAETPPPAPAPPPAPGPATKAQPQVAAAPATPPAAGVKKPGKAEAPAPTPPSPAPATTPAPAATARSEEPAGGGAHVNPTSQINHTMVDSAPPNQPLDLTVETPVMRGVKLLLNFRGQGQADFTQLEMKRHGPEKIARIPAAAMQGKSIQYYIEAKDATGNIIKTFGTQVDPNIVFLDASATRVVRESAGEDCEGEDCPQKVRRAGVEDRSDNAFVKLPPLKEGRKPKEKTGPTFSALGWAGLGVALAGVLAVVPGAVLAYYAFDRANTIAVDAEDKNCRSRLAKVTAGMGTSAGLCFFNNPKDVSPTDYDYQNQGQTFALAADVLIPVGGVMIAGGIAMMVIDSKKLHPSKPAPPKARRTGQGGPAIHNLVVLPSLSTTSVGLGAGFRF